MRRPMSSPWSSWRKWLASGMTSATSVAQRLGEALARSATGRTGSRVGPEHELRAGVPAQGFEHALAGLGARGVGLGGEHQREGAGAGLARRVGVGRVVGGDDVVAGIGVAGAAHEEADREVLRALDEVAERDPGVGHALVAGEEAGVDGSTSAGDPVRRARPRARSPIGPAPVVDDDGRVAEVELARRSARERRRVPVVGVPVEVDRLVGAAEAGEVRGDAAIARPRAPVA